MYFRLDLDRDFECVNSAFGRQALAYFVCVATCECDPAIAWKVFKWGYANAVAVLRTWS